MTWYCSLRRFDVWNAQIKRCHHSVAYLRTNTFFGEQTLNSCRRQAHRHSEVSSYAQGKSLHTQICAVQANALRTVSYLSGELLADPSRICYQQSADFSATNFRRPHRRRRVYKRQIKLNLNPAERENKHGALSVAASMLIQDVGAVESLHDGDSAVKDRLEASFAEMEKLASIKIKEATVIEEEEDDPTSDLEDQTSASLPRSGAKAVKFYGTPDPSVPVSNVPCHGCGATLHCQDPGVQGYLPSQIFVTLQKSELEETTCQRCHLLKSFNLAIDVSIGPSDYQAVVREVKRQTSLLVVVVDLTDLPNSLHRAVASMADKRRRPIYLIGNKVDLLPKDKDGYLERIKESMLSLCEEYGISNEEVRHVALISAKTGYGIENLITQLICDWNRKGQIYLLGCTNAGKSTLFNALLSSDYCRSTARDIIQRATTSVWPGTTLSLLKFPIVNPKPSFLHARNVRLKTAWREEYEERKLREKSLKESDHWRYATLTGHMGTSFLSPKQIVVHDKLSQSAGFVVPSYTFSDEENFKDHTGENGFSKLLNPEKPKYDDSTFKFWCHDTPGYINPDQIVNVLNTKELLTMLPKKLITPRTFILWPNQVMFVSGLGRIDYKQGEKSIYLTVFASDKIPVFVKKSDKADDFYKTNVGTDLLGVPHGDAARLSQLPPLVGKEFQLIGLGWGESVADVVLSSLGWVSVTAPRNSLVSLTAYTPGGMGCVLRTPALLKYAFLLRGKPIPRSSAFTTRPPKTV